MYFNLTRIFFFLLGIYLTVVMAITSISVVVTVVVLNFHYRGPSRKEVPSYLRDLVLQRVNSSCSCFCLRSPKKKKTCTSYDIVQLPTYKVNITHVTLIIFLNGMYTVELSDYRFDFSSETKDTNI